jgi:hypothetical protein
LHRSCSTIKLSRQFPLAVHTDRDFAAFVNADENSTRKVQTVKAFVGSQTDLAPDLFEFMRCHPFFERQMIADRGGHETLPSILIAG